MAAVKKLLTFLIAVPLAALLTLRLSAALLGYTSLGSMASGEGPLVIVSILAIGFALVSYVLGLVTGDLSWVDRMWSTVPVLYAWIYAHMAGYDMRTTIAAILVSVWGVRLTFNFVRRGGYTTAEDYRWSVLRGRIGSPVSWQVFSFLFISVYQNALFVLFTLPLYALHLNAGGKPGPAFWAGAAAFLVFLFIETVADQQQWEFQEAKRTSPTAGPHGEDIRRGFRTTGLFRWSRHPNYFGELMIWWMVYLMGTTSLGTAIHWTGLGAVLLTALFVGSTAFTESITRKKYADYDRYRQTTSAVIPLPRRRAADTEASGEIS